MADYYSEASFIALSNLTPVEVEWLVGEFSVDPEDLADEEQEVWAAARGLETPCHWGFAHKIVDTVDTTGAIKSLWIYSDCCFDPANVAGFLHHMLTTLRPEFTIGFEWSNSCSKARIDAFGGGAAVVTKEGVEWCNTNEWLSMKMEISG